MTAWLISRRDRLKILAREWLQLQENPRLGTLLRFLRAHPASPKLFGGVSIDRVEEILRRALADILIDDLDLLREYGARRTESADSTDIVRGLSALRFLPQHATLRDFLATTQQIFEQLNWLERWAEVERLSREWSESISHIFQREIYLRWLAEITSSFARVRDEQGDHPYSRVHLLLYAHAAGQEWSHLIFAGMNEGAWPRPNQDFGFIRDEDIRVLNRRAMTTGNQGEGHSVIREGKTLCLGGAEKRQLASRQLASLIESAEKGIGVTANLQDASSPSRTANPSEFFTRLYFSARKQAVSQATMTALHKRTRAWLREWDSPKNADVSPAVADIAQSRVAYDARKSANPAGEYEFFAARSVTACRSNLSHGLGASPPLSRDCVDENFSRRRER